ncbi:glycosyltransferase family 2 protein [Marinilactibacillus psychrotolerans]|uniref:glycosyltransferase family 2 protein n=1 Tax=Marinilactibacillus psychrotolerans TaxID=191770 RepID=UPI0039B084C5
MNQQPFFSIVMPAYNCEKTIGKTIESIQDQQWQDFELIIINDGSTDKTGKVINSFTKKDDRITLITIPNGGPGNARNKGIDQASGFYLVLLDADDALPQETLQTYANYLKQKNPDLIISSYEMQVMDGKELVDKRVVQVSEQWIPNHTLFLERLYPLMEKQLMYVIWNKVYKLDIVKENNIQFPPYSSCEDRLFNIGYYHQVKTCQVLNNILYHYSFDGKNSLTNKFLPNKFETFEEFYVALLNLTTKNIAGSSALFLKGTMSCIIPFHSEECPYSFSKKLKEIKRILRNDHVNKAVKYSATNSLIRKVMTGLFKSKSVIINYIASFIMYKISHVSPKVIEKIKGNF